MDEDKMFTQLQITWRALSPADEIALLALDAAVKSMDGNEPISHLPAEALHALEKSAQDTLCASRDDGSLAGVAWVRAQDKRRCQLGGKVDPDFRRQGLGTHLLAWSMERAGQNALEVLTLTNEALTPDAHSLYLAHGFLQVMAENWMLRDLSQSLPQAAFPAGVRLIPWTAESAPQFFRAYQRAFRDRPGFPDPAQEDWIADYLDSPDFRPDLSLCAVADGECVGFITCDVSADRGWIDQVGVAPDERRRGLAGNLILSALHRFRAEGLQEASLHVNINNPGAVALYRRLGFVCRLQRARYQKEV